MLTPHVPHNKPRTIDDLLGGVNSAQKRFNDGYNRNQGREQGSGGKKLTGVVRVVPTTRRTR